MMMMGKKHSCSSGKTDASWVGGRLMMMEEVDGADVQLGELLRARPII